MRHNEGMVVNTVFFSSTAKRRSKVRHGSAGDVEHNFIEWKWKAYLFFCVGDELHAAGAREAVDGLQNTVQ
jgi:hypothetical protein